MANLRQPLLGGEEEKSYSKVKQALLDGVKAYVNKCEQSKTEDNPENTYFRGEKRQDIGVTQFFQRVKLFFGGAKRNEQRIDEIVKAKDDNTVLNIAKTILEKSSDERLKLYVAVYLIDVVGGSRIPNAYYRVPLDVKEAEANDFTLQELKNNMKTDDFKGEKFYTFVNLGGFISMNGNAVRQLEKGVLQSINNKLQSSVQDEQVTNRNGPTPRV